MVFSSWTLVFPWFSHEFTNVFPMFFQWFSHDFPMIFPCFSDVFPMFFPMIFPIEQTAVVCGGGAFRVSCGALDHGAGPEKLTIKVTWSPKRWEWTIVYNTVYIYSKLASFVHMSDKIPMHHLMYTQEQSGLKIQGPVNGEWWSRRCGGGSSWDLTSSDPFFGRVTELSFLPCNLTLPP